jgi:hypothetical protein
LRCSERIGLNLEQIKDLILFTYPLPQEREFTGVESSFRLAVEYLVQSRLYEKRKEVIPAFQIISNIATNARVNNSKVIHHADKIVNHFLINYSEI